MRKLSCQSPFSLPCYCVIALLFYFVFPFLFPSPALSAGPAPTCNPSQVLIYSPFNTYNSVFDGNPSFKEDILWNKEGDPRSFDPNPTREQNCNNRSDLYRQGSTQKGQYTLLGYSYCNAAPLITNIPGNTTATDMVGCWPIFKEINTLNQGSIVVSPECPKECSAFENNSCREQAFGRTNPCPDPKIVPACSNRAGNYTLNPGTGKCVLVGAAPPPTPPGGTPVTGEKIYLCTPDTDGGNCDTALGSIPINPAAFFSFILKFLLGISGAIVLVMLILTGYSVMTSSGDPEKLKNAKDSMTSIIAGLVLIIFSMVLLRAVGADILGLPPLATIMGPLGRQTTSASKTADEYCRKTGEPLDECYFRVLDAIEKGNPY